MLVHSQAESQARGRALKATNVAARPKVPNKQQVNPSLWLSALDCTSPFELLDSGLSRVRVHHTLCEELVRKSARAATAWRAGWWQARLSVPREVGSGVRCARSKRTPAWAVPVRLLALLVTRFRSVATALLTSLAGQSGSASPGAGALKAVVMFLTRAPSLAGCR